MDVIYLKGQSKKKKHMVNVILPDMENIPAYVKQNIFPTDSLNALGIISFPCPPITNLPQLLLGLTDLFSKNSVLPLLV